MRILYIPVFDFFLLSKYADIVAIISKISHGFLTDFVAKIAIYWQNVAIFGSDFCV